MLIKPASMRTFSERFLALCDGGVEVAAALEVNPRDLLAQLLTVNR
jgi:hypothetical protein